MILIIDNYDSFTYNIAQYFQILKEKVVVKRNNKITIKEIKRLKPQTIILSPGPGTPKESGFCFEIIKHFKGKIPIFGICLGHQIIGEFFGAHIVISKKLYHGKISQIHHYQKGIFTSIPSPHKATRYHSLLIDSKSLPNDFIITAKSENKEIMGIKHVKYPIEGVQFHPESIESDYGMILFKNFLSEIKKEKKTLMKTSSKDKKEININKMIEKLLDQQPLLQQEAKEMMKIISEGKLSDLEITTILVALRTKGESIEEITGFASFLRENAIKIKTPKNQIILDTCGTGGDKSGTFNISTISAFVIAASGIYVAKHGNRSMTSKCGSADVLEALKISLNLSLKSLETCLDKIGITFLFAQKFHPAMKHVIQIRKALKTKTIFNLLGPLASPANAKVQIMGVFSKDLTNKIASVLLKLGVQKGMVFHGLDGLDEVSLTTNTQISQFDANTDLIKNYQFNPQEYRLQYCSPKDLKGGDALENKEIFLSILKGDKGPKREIVLLNAAFGLLACSKAKDLKEAIEIAAYNIDQGLALKKLQDLIQLSQQLK